MSLLVPRPQVQPPGEDDDEVPRLQTADNVFTCRVKCQLLKQVSYPCSYILIFSSPFGVGGRDFPLPTRPCLIVSQLIFPPP